MQTLPFDKRRRLLIPPGFQRLLFGLAFVAGAGAVPAQPTPRQDAPTVTPAPQPPGSGQPAPGPGAGAGQPPNPVPPPAGAPSSLPGAAPPLLLPAIPQLRFHADEIQRLDRASGEVTANGNIVVEYAGTTVKADHLEGNFNRELIFRGHARIESRGAVSDADAIHVFPNERSYRLDNPRGVLPPEFLQNRVAEPVFLSGGTLTGTSAGYTRAENLIATTCIEKTHHYELRIGSAELFPYKRLILRRVGVVLFGKKLVVLPLLVVPLDRTARRPRTDYLPEFGQNINEGYYARFPYAFAIGGAAAAFVRLDLTQLRGPGLRFEQEYLAGKQDSYFDTSPTGGGFNGGFGVGGSEGALTSAYGYGTLGPRLPRLGTGLGPQNGGLFAMQGYLRDGFDRNFNASFRHQQSIGGANRFALTTELLRNSFYSFENQTSQNSRFDFAHTDPTHGVNAQFTLGLNTNNSGGFDTSQFTSSYRQSWEFDSNGSNRNNLSVDFDLSRFVTRSLEVSSRTARLNSEFEYQHVSRDYSFTTRANKSSPIGSQSDQSAFGTLERLPELEFTADTINFQRGWLKRVPARFDIGVGQYSEPGSNINTNRVLLGLTLQDFAIARGNTEITTGGGFEQRLYGDGAAQYIVRNTTRLRQRLGGRSGFDLNYQYEEPAGGTPFLFDTFGRTHYISAEGGYLNDPRFQITARVGYDFLGTSQDRPWQSLSTRLMWRPTPSVRLDALASYDPNTSRFFSLSNSFRFRARNDFAFDLLTRYDPEQGKFSQVNGQFDIPLGRTWRVLGLLRYNGFTGKFESTNLQILKRWDCLEASVTYSESPLSFRSERQLYFSLRITAFPFFRSFARGPAGDAIGPGLGDLY